VTAPLLPIAFAFAAGVGLGLVVPTPGWVLPAGGILTTLAIGAIWRDRLVAARFAVLLLVCLAGWVRPALPDPMPEGAALRAGRLVLEGLVTGDPTIDGPRTRLPLWLRRVWDATGSTPAAGDVRVQLYGTPPAIEPADRVRVMVDLRETRPFRNPGSGQHAGTSPARRPRLIAVGRTDSLEALPRGPVPWWLATRLWVHRLVERHLPPVSGALFEGLLIGERRQLPPGLVTDFRAAGVFHILAISGFNVALVAGAVFFLLRLVMLPRRAAALLALAALAGFATVVGARPSVLRATLMAALVLGGLLLGRESRVWNSLAAALLVLLSWHPPTLFDSGLQLSFAATAGILHLGPPIRRTLETRLPALLANAVAVSAGAQLAVTPLMVAHWNQVSLIGVAANLLVVPLAGGITVLGLLAVLVAAASDALAHLMFQSLWMLLLILRLLVRAIASLPWAMVHVPSPPPLALAVATAALVVGPRLRGRAARLALATLIGLAGVATAIQFLPDGRLHLLVLDVGQGEAVLIRGPDGQALLVDTGGGGRGRTDRGERVVLPALYRTGIRRLAALVVTHDDPDHAGGLASLLEGLRVEEVWGPAGRDGGAWERPVRAAGLRPRRLARGDRIWIGPLLVTVLHPPREDPRRAPTRARDDNNGSLVLRLEWGLMTALLTGDAEAPAERDVMAADLPLRTLALKVGHHGSRHASSAPFLARLRPRVALISVGARNAFGHPNPTTLARLVSAGAAVYRTDLDGAVELVSDGERVWVRRWAFPSTVETFLLRGAP
jgi:competence protein ComEC